MKCYLIELNGKFIKEYKQKRAAILDFENLVAKRIELTGQSISLIEKDVEYHTLCDFFNY